VFIFSDTSVQSKNGQFSLPYVARNKKPAFHAVRLSCLENAY